MMIGVSAWGVEALPRLIGSLLTDLPGAVFVVLHGEECRSIWQRYKSL